VCIWDVPAHNVVFCRYFMTSVLSTNNKLTVTKLSELAVLLMALLHTVDIHVSVHHDIEYENDQQDATV